MSLSGEKYHVIRLIKYTLLRVKYYLSVYVCGWEVLS